VAERLERFRPIPPYVPRLPSLNRVDPCSRVSEYLERMMGELTGNADRPGALIAEMTELLREQVRRTDHMPEHHHSQEKGMTVSELQELPRQLRQLPPKLQRGEIRLLDAATLAGELLLRAVERGVFSAEHWISFCRVVELATRGELEHQLGHPPGTRRAGQGISPPPAWHAFVNAYVWLRKAAGCEAGEFDDSFIMNGCPQLADLIEAEAEHIGNGSPEATSAVGDGPASGGAATAESVSEGHSELKPAQEIAYQQFNLAEERMPEPLKTDREAYDWLREHADCDELGRLPAFKTWARHVRAARRHYGTQKHKPRHGRTGRSVVSAGGLDQPRSRGS